MDKIFYLWIKYFILSIDEIKYFISNPHKGHNAITSKNSTSEQ